MATKSSLISISIVITLAICGLCSSCPCHTKRAVVVQSDPDNSSMAITDVLIGIQVTNRLVLTTLLQLPRTVYDVENRSRTMQEAMSSLTVIQQYSSMIVTLQRSGLNTTELELYRLLLQGLLVDTCEWLDSFDGVSLDCTDPELKQFIPVILSLGLRNELDRLNCYIRGFPKADVNPSPGSWIDNTIAPMDPTNIRCEFCSRTGLKNCNTCTADM